MNLSYIVGAPQLCGQCMHWFFVVHETTDNFDDKQTGSYMYLLVAFLLLSSLLAIPEDRPFQNKQLALRNGLQYM